MEVRAARAAVRTLLTLFALVAGVAGERRWPRRSSAHAEEPVALVQITLKSINPALPTRDGQITLTGTATNITAERIFRAQAYFWRNQAPITDREGFDQALASESNDPLGRREVVGYQNLYAETDPYLEPGESRDFTLTVPVAQLELSPTDGIYLMGVHVLQNNAPGRRPGPGVRPGRRDPADRAAADDLAGHLHLAAVPGPHRRAGRRPPGPRGRPERPAEQAARRRRRGRPELRRRPGAARRPADHGRRLRGAGR